MAKQVLVELIDDIDGSQAAETLEFALDGVRYEIDLSAENAKDLRESLARYVGHARRTGVEPRRGAGRGPGSGSSSRLDREQNQAIRAWARENGYEISDRGRLASEIVDAYHNNHGEN